jgi:hypothetical protein
MLSTTVKSGHLRAERRKIFYLRRSASIHLSIFAGIFTFREPSAFAAE